MASVSYTTLASSVFKIHADEVTVLDEGTVCFRHGPTSITVYKDGTLVDEWGKTRVMRDWDRIYFARWVAEMTHDLRLMPTVTVYGTVWRAR